MNRSISSSSKILQLHHVQLAMPAQKEAQAIGFYRDLLGIPLQAKPAHLAARGGCWFEQGAELRIHLGVDPHFVPAQKAHPALLVSHLDLLVQKLKAHGVRVTTDEPPLLAGYNRVYVSDPFGNRIELLEPLPPVEIVEQHVNKE